MPLVGGIQASLVVLGAGVSAHVVKPDPAGPFTRHLKKYFFALTIFYFIFVISVRGSYTLMTDRKLDCSQTENCQLFPILTLVPMDVSVGIMIWVFDPEYRQRHSHRLAIGQSFVSAFESIHRISI